MCCRFFVWIPLYSDISCNSSSELYRNQKIKFHEIKGKQEHQSIVSHSSYERRFIRFPIIQVVRNDVRHVILSRNRFSGMRQIWDFVRIFNYINCTDDFGGNFTSSWAFIYIEYFSWEAFHVQNTKVFHLKWYEIECMIV